MAAVRLTDFWERMELVFGPSYARSWAHDMVLPGLGLLEGQAVTGGMTLLGLFHDAPIIS